MKSKRIYFKKTGNLHTVYHGINKPSVTYMEWCEDKVEKYYGYKCKHSFVEAQGVGGGHIFLFCNKCGFTKNRKMKPAK